MNSLFLGGQRASLTRSKALADSRNPFSVFSVLLVAVVFLLSACSEPTGYNSNQGPDLIAAEPRGGGPEVITTREEDSVLRRFFSRDNLRATYFSGDTTPRLAGDTSGDPTGNLDLRIVNQNDPTGLNAEYQTEFDTSQLVISPIRHQQIIGGEWQPRENNGPSVGLNYDDEPLRNVAEDVLGGILSVNYILSDNIDGTVTFRSERRFSRVELLQILSDILAREGYLIQYFNSVYHVGPPDELETLTGLRGRTALDGDQNYVIHLGPNAPENIGEVAAALIPPGNTIILVPETGNLLVRGDPSQFQAIEGLVRSLAGRGNSQQVLSIIPLRRAAPEMVALQMAETYEARQLGDVLFVPIEQRESILVVASTREEINQARDLARSLDVNTRDPVRLRVIQLTHLDADEVADRLGQIYGGGTVGGGDGGTQQNDQASAIMEAADQLANPDQEGEQAQGDEQREVTPAERSDAITFVADPGSNAVMIRSSYQDFRRIQEVVATLDVPQAQVVIEATIIEVFINDALQYGVQTYLERGGWTMRSSAGSGGVGDPGGGGFAAVFQGTVGSTNIQAVISALQSVTEVHVISSPYLTVSNGGTANLTVGDQIPYVTASQSSSSGGEVVVTQEIASLDVGVILNVTPTIRPSNNVILDISQQISSARVDETAAGQNPVISQRSVNSTVQAQSGQTILLGGLIEERSNTGESGVPVLRRIPILGTAFSQRTNTQTRSELLIMLTPRVVRNSNSLADLTQQLQVWNAQ